MRITLNIDDKQLKEVQASTGLHKKSPAIERAVELYIRDVRKKKILQKVMEGKCDYSLTNEELEQRSLYDPH